jgi:hypothetical protein
MEHNLKTCPEFFDAVLKGDKTFEVRLNDRGFRVGDNLVLKEWLPNTKQYTGRQTKRSITYILSGLGLQPNWIVMAIKYAEDLPF